MASAFDMIGNDTTPISNNSDNIMDQLSGNDSGESLSGLNFENLKTKRNALFTLSKKYNLLDISEDKSISDFKELNLKIIEIGDLINGGENDIEGYMRKADFLLKEIKSKIDQAFQEKIKAILSGEEKSEKAKTTTTTTIKKDKTNYTEGGAYSDIDTSMQGGMDSPATGSVLVEKSDKEIEKNINLENPIKKYELFLAYLDFKGYDKNSVFYQNIEINLNFLKKDPFLISKNSTNKSFIIGSQKLTYGEYLKKYIDDNILNIINGEKVKFAKLTKENYNSFLKEKNNLKNQISKDKVDDSFTHTSFLDPLNAMNEARDKITEINGLKFDDLYKNIEKYTSDKFEYEEVENLKTRLDFFIERSNGEGEENKTLAKYIKEHKNEVLEELEKAEILFKKYKESLKEVKNILDSYNGNIPEDVKKIAEKEIKGLISGMLFINGLHEDSIFNLITRVTPLGLGYTFIKNNINEYFAYGFLGLFIAGITSKHIAKKYRKIKFLSAIEKGNSDKENEGEENKEKKSLKKKFKELLNKKMENFTVNDIDKLIEKITEDGKGEKLKEQFEKYESIFERLKIFRDIKEIIRNENNFKKVKNKGLDINSIFLNDKEFARDIISQIITKGEKNFFLHTTPNGIATALRIYLSLGIIERVGDFTNTIPFKLGKNRPNFPNNKIKDISIPKIDITYWKGKSFSIGGQTFKIKYGIKNATESLDEFINNHSDKITNPFNKKEQSIKKGANKIFKDLEIVDDINDNKGLIDKIIEKASKGYTEDIISDEEKLKTYNKKLESIKNNIKKLITLSKNPNFSTYNIIENLETNINDIEDLDNFEEEIEKIENKLTEAKKLIEKLGTNNLFEVEYIEVLDRILTNKNGNSQEIKDLITEVEETNKIKLLTDNSNFNKDINEKIKEKIKSIINLSGSQANDIFAINENYKIYNDLLTKANGHDLESKILDEIKESYTEKSLEYLNNNIDKYNEIKKKINSKFKDSVKGEISKGNSKEVIFDDTKKTNFINRLKTGGFAEMETIEAEFDSLIEEIEKTRKLINDYKKEKIDAEERDKDRKSKENIAKETAKKETTGEKIIVINSETTEEKIDKLLKKVEYLKILYPKEFENINNSDLIFEDDKLGFIKEKTGLQNIEFLETKIFKNAIKSTLGINDLEDIFEEQGKIKKVFKNEKQTEFEDVKKGLLKKLKEGKI